VLFWGLVTVPNWCYDCVYTCAQIELMFSDVPVISYKRDKNKPPSKKEVEETKRLWKEKGERHIDINDFLRNPALAARTGK
jgi:hypothetical protein